MRTLKESAALLAITVLATSCAHSIHEVHVSDFRPYTSHDGGDIVSGRAEQFTIMGFVQNTDYVDQAYHKLRAACPNGEITGITTQISTSLGFFSWTNKALMQGMCVARR